MIGAAAYLNFSVHAPNWFRSLIPLFSFIIPLFFYLEKYHSINSIKFRIYIVNGICHVEIIRIRKMDSILTVYLFHKCHPIVTCTVLERLISPLLRSQFHVVHCKSN